MRWQKKPSIEKTISQDEIEVLEASGEMRSTQSPVSVNSGRKHTFSSMNWRNYWGHTCRNVQIITFE